MHDDSLSVACGCQVLAEPGLEPGDVRLPHGLDVTRSGHAVNCGVRTRRPRGATSHFRDSWIPNLSIAPPQQHRHIIRGTVGLLGYP
jgi:hypothetical protein